MSNTIRIIPALMIVALGAIALKTAGLAETAAAEKTASEASDTTNVAGESPSESASNATDNAGQPTPLEPAASAAAPTCSPNDRYASEAGLTPEEFRVLQALGARREALEARDAELDTREKLVEAAGNKIEERVAEIKRIEATIQKLVDDLDAKQDAEVERLVKVYEKMKPKDAATILNELNDPIGLEVAAKMKEASLSLILSQMLPDRARALTIALAKRSADKAKEAAKAIANAPDTNPAAAKPAPA